MIVKPGVSGGSPDMFDILVSHGCKEATFRGQLEIQRN
jgi:hypothetical protein